jgi:RNA polymerase sigma factor (sigma-70 family)
VQSKFRSDEMGEYLTHFSEEQIEEIYPKLRRYCQFLTQNSWDGDDLVQEALLKVWRHYQHSPEVSTALLNKIAHNKWIDTVRKQNKESVEVVPEASFTETEQVHNRIEAIEMLINALTPKQSVIFILKEAFYFQNAEIAELLGTTETAIKAAVHRAKQRLAKQELIDGTKNTNQYWNQQEREHLTTLLHKTLVAQDPTILIKAIPFIRSLKKKQPTVPKCFAQHSRLSHTPSSIVYIAA